MKELEALPLSTYSDHLPVQYAESFNLRKFIEVFLSQVESLDAAIVDLDKGSTDIDVAYGYQLDIIGKLVGADREGRDDTAYRKYIKFRITTNTGSGTPEDVIYFMKSMIPTASNIQIFEHYPSSIYVHVTGEVDPFLEIMSELEGILPAACSASYVSYASSARVLTPYTTTYTLIPLKDDNGNEITDSMGNLVMVTQGTYDANKASLGVLSELYVNVDYDITTDTGNEVVTNTGDTLQVFTYKDAVSSGGVNILPEVLPHNN